ncbi:hypothetical protein L226DRAFT_537589 [Lentinus tigrinus ALCF2SS1-7]|uniref:Uncharacterized protein n=1 Tax=Lentinus tigrinus ALCF2SS1-6 TaxID=1328759 RepID=A0A5C2S4E2_9APHY|nr:hypothetical protein L227DRAFT_655339 [Lentinus tigrinus ALCF2SS1-6]RPD71841.1 hypothetical protein L226DRAFT_537589 [Lentinus tigrinus ALCF2SS1-7]
MAPAMTKTSRSPSSSRPRAKRVMKISVESPATRGYGFMLDDGCLRHWAKIIYEEVYGSDILSKMTAKEAEEAIDLGLAVAPSVILQKVYRQFPRIPRLRRRLALVDPDEGRYVVVLKDNSSQAALSATISPEDVEGVRKMLDLGEQKPRWHYLPQW